MNDRGGETIKPKENAVKEELAKLQEAEKLFVELNIVGRLAELDHEVRRNQEPGSMQSRIEIISNYAPEIVAQGSFSGAHIYSNKRYGGETGPSYMQALEERLHFLPQKEDEPLPAYRARMYGVRMTTDGELQFVRQQRLVKPSQSGNYELEQERVVHRIKPSNVMRLKEDQDSAALRLSSGVRRLLPQRR